jgi:hypothetical protein
MAMASSPDPRIEFTEFAAEFRNEAFAKRQYGQDAHDKANSAKQHSRPRSNGHAG